MNYKINKQTCTYHSKNVLVDKPDQVVLLRHANSCTTLLRKLMFSLNNLKRNTKEKTNPVLIKE